MGQEPLFGAMKDTSKDGCNVDKICEVGQKVSGGRSHMMLRHSLESTMIEL